MLLLTFCLTRDNYGVYLVFNISHNSSKNICANTYYVNVDIIKLYRDSTLNPDESSKRILVTLSIPSHYSHDDLISILEVQAGTLIRQGCE